MRFVLLIATYFSSSLVFSVDYSQSGLYEVQSNLEHLEHNPRISDQGTNYTPKKTYNNHKTAIQSGEHAHTKGGWMFTYRTMDMHMEETLMATRVFHQMKLLPPSPTVFMVLQDSLLH